MVSKTNKEKDIFKINLLNMMDKQGFTNTFILTTIIMSFLVLIVGIIIYIMV